MRSFSKFLSFLVSISLLLIPCVVGRRGEDLAHTMNPWLTGGDSKNDKDSKKEDEPIFDTGPQYNAPVGAGGLFGNNGLMDYDSLSFGGYQAPQRQQQPQQQWQQQQQQQYRQGQQQQYQQQQSPPQQQKQRQQAQVSQKNQQQSSPLQGPQQFQQVPQQFQQVPQATLQNQWDLGLVTGETRQNQNPWEHTGQGHHQNLAQGQGDFNTAHMNQQYPDNRGQGGGGGGAINNNYMNQIPAPYQSAGEGGRENSLNAASVQAVQGVQGVQVQGGQPEVEQKLQDDDEPNEWLFKGEKLLPTFSPEDERIRQQNFEGMNDKWKWEEMERRKQEMLRNREGEITLDKTHMTLDELQGKGNRIAFGTAVIPGGGQQGHGQIYIPPQPPPPQYPYPNHPGAQGHFFPPQSQGQGDPDFFRPENFYHGKIRPEEGTQFLVDTYRIPGDPKGRNYEGPQQPLKKRNHAMDDPPSEIMPQPRWFDDEYNAEAEASRGSSSPSKLNFVIIGINLILVLILR